MVIRSLRSDLTEETGMFDVLFSRRAKAMKASEIRELLKLVTASDVISFAGGLPNPDSFPVDEMEGICRATLEKYGKRAMQYGTTEGVKEFREAIAGRINKRYGLNLTEDNIVVTGGSQQGLDILGKIFIDPNDPIIVEMPSYLGALSAFKTYDPDFIGIPLDNNGMDVNMLEERLVDLEKRTSLPKFVYVVPTFQNPTGVTLSEKRRKKLLDLAHEYAFIIIEDSPYDELRYSGDDISSLFAMDPERVLSLGTFSKIFAPGIRLAWIAGHEDLIRKIVVAKQSTDLCTASFNQYVLTEYINQGLLDPHIEEIRVLYSRKRDVMLDALEEYMPDGVEWTRPDGGMFLWVTGPSFIDTSEMFSKAIQRRVAYVVGSAFFHDGSGRNSMRLNFSYPTDERIVEGVRRLAEVFKESIAEKAL